MALLLYVHPKSFIKQALVVNDSLTEEVCITPVLCPTLFSISQFCKTLSRPGISVWEFPRPSASFGKFSRKWIYVWKSPCWLMSIGICRRILKYYYKFILLECFHILTMCTYFIHRLYLLVNSFFEQFSLRKTTKHSSNNNEDKLKLFNY